MQGISKHLSSIVLTLMAVGTILNSYFIKDYKNQWFVAMLLLAIYLVLFSYSRWKQKKSFINLIVLIIFLTEMFGVLIGFNLSTYYLPELIISLCIIGLISKFKR